MPEEALVGALARSTLFCRVNAAAERTRPARAEAARPRGRLPGRRHQRRPGPACRRCRHFGRQRGRRRREAADLILLEHDLSRACTRRCWKAARTCRNVTKYILMGSSSNFGNMFSMAGAALFLPFLPMLPIQVLLNNLLYDCCRRLAIPFDRVEKRTQQPAHWDFGLIRALHAGVRAGQLALRFSDLLCPAALFGAGEALFQTGWFVETLATQVLVIFAIRTKRPLFRSAPHPLLAGMVCGVVALGLLLPFTAPGRWFGFVPLPPLFFVYLLLAILAYLALVEGAKCAFYRRNACPTG